MTGSDIFLVNKSVELILQASGIDKMNVVRLDDGVGLNEINIHLSNVSMFGGGVAVVVRTNDETRLFLKPVKDLKQAEKVDCNPMSENLVVRLIMQNKFFNQDTAMKLAKICENDFARVYNEMQKLEAYGTFDESIITKTEKYQVYELSNALIKKDIARAENILKSFSESGVDDYAVFGNLVSFARRLFYCKQSPMSDGDLAKFLGVNPYAVIALRRDTRNITKSQATEIYGRALDLEYQIKSGRVATNRAVILLVGEFV